jgi:hypothetical protein
VPNHGTIGFSITRVLRIAIREMEEVYAKRRAYKALVARLASTLFLIPKEPCSIHQLSFPFHTDGVRITYKVYILHCRVLSDLARVRLSKFPIYLPTSRRAAPVQ